MGGYGFTSCGYTSTNVGTTQRFDDTANSHTARANAYARRHLAGYAFNGYGFTSCGYTGSNPGVGTTERFDDTANTHTARANASARYNLAGYAFGGYGFTSCGYTSTQVGTTERFDDTANSHTSRADATARRELAGYAFGGYGFTSCGYTSTQVGTTERFDDTANSHTARANATARNALTGYTLGGYGFTSCGYTSANVGTTERFDDVANSHTARANATARRELAGYAFGGYGFTSCGYTTGNVGTTERFDDTANSHTARANATARRHLTGYAFPDLDNFSLWQSAATVSSITLAWNLVREGIQDIQTEIYEGDVETNMSLLTTTSAGATSYTRSGLGQRVAKFYKTRWKWGSYTSSSYSSVIVGKTYSRLSIEDAQGGAGVRDPSNNLVAGAKVFIKDALSGTLLGVVTTDSSGKATFDTIAWPKMLSVDFEPQRDNVFTQVFADNFTTLSSNWVKLEGSGSASVVSDANASDGYALEANGYVYYEHNQNIQLDPEAIYRIRAKIRQVSDPTTGGKAHLRRRSPA
jgi:hypothetical protein